MNEQATEPQAEMTTARLMALLAAWRIGQIDAPDMSRGAAVALYAGKVLASRYGDIAVSTLAHRPPLGIVPGPQHLDRLIEAVQTVIEDADEDPGPRLERLAVSEVEESHVRTLRAAIEGQGYAQWREDVAADACEVCQPFADRLHEAAEAFAPHHPRCRCQPVPVGEPAPEVSTVEPIRARVRITYEVA